MQTPQFGIILVAVFFLIQFLEFNDFNESRIIISKRSSSFASLLVIIYSIMLGASISQGISFGISFQFSLLVASLIPVKILIIMNACVLCMVLQPQFNNFV